MSSVGAHGRYFQTIVPPAIAVPLLLVEGVLLYLGQRRLFGLVVRAAGKHVGYLVAAPGTILHEASHYLLCLLLGVPAGADVLDASGRRARVSFFFPRQQEDGSLILGSVPHAATDPWRGALIAVAPAILVPGLLVGLSYLLLGAHVLTSPWHAFGQAVLWKEVLWVWVALSCGQAAFPSPGDHIGALGAVALAATAALIILGVRSADGMAGVDHLLRGATEILAVPAVSAAAAMGALTAWLSVRP